MRYARRGLLAPFAAVAVPALGLVFTLATATAGVADDEDKPSTSPSIKVGARLDRRGDEIMVCGQLFHTTAPVVLWTDPGGYDAYRVERRFAPRDQASWEATRKAVPAITAPNRYSQRRRGLTEGQVEAFRGGGWEFDALRSVVDQFVIHFDARGTSRRCFEVLHDLRGLSVHFMLDLDGTIYQTLDVKERAWHATIANDRSIGIEIANIGAYPLDAAEPLDLWYARGDDGKTRLTIPGPADRSGLRDRSATLRPSRDQPIVGTIQGRGLRQYDLTPQQYESLAKLTATLCAIFPKIACDYPRDASGKLVPRKLSDAELAKYQGVLGHYHVQTNKVDPGPAFQWDALVTRARALLGEADGK